MTTHRNYTIHKAIGAASYLFVGDYKIVIIDDDLILVFSCEDGMPKGIFGYTQSFSDLDSAIDYAEAN